MAGPSPLAGTGGKEGLGTLPPPPTPSAIWVTLPEGAVGYGGLMVRSPLISSGRDTGCTTQPPIVGNPYLGKSRQPHPEEAAGPPCLRPHLSLPLGGWRAWQSWYLGAGAGAGLDPCLPPPPRSLDFTSGPGGVIEREHSRAWVSAVLQKGSSGGSGMNWKMRGLGQEEREAVEAGSQLPSGTWLG